MEAFFEGWGLSLNQTLLLLAVILIVVDFFVATDILTHAAYIILCCVVASNMPVHIMYKILIGLACWFVIVTLHYLLFRSLIQKVIDRKIAPDKYRAGAEGLVNMVGEIKEIEGRKMVAVEGDLWPIASAEDLRPGEKVKIINAQDGILSVEQAERKP